MVCTTAPPPNGINRDTNQTKRGTGALPFYGCRCIEHEEKLKALSHGWTSGSVECQQAVVMSADFRMNMLTHDVIERPLALWRACRLQECPQTFKDKPCGLWWLNAQEFQLSRYAIISSLNGGSP